MQNRYLPNIICPSCKTGGLNYNSDAENEATCGSCNKSYPVKNKIIDLIPGVAYERSVSQAFMEWSPLIRIYESRLWRKSPMFAFSFGISFRREYNIIVDSLKLKSYEPVLDLACGPGTYTRAFAKKENCKKVVGLDLSLPMLDYASRASKVEKIEDLALVRGSALEAPFPDNEFYAINCCGALHLFPNIPRALNEICRVLKPGGRFACAVFRKRPGKMGDRAADFRKRRMGITQFSEEELESLCKRAGLSNIKILHSKRYWILASAAKPT